MYCVFILFSLKDQKLYIGSTSNLKRRLIERFHGKSKNTSRRRPIRLIFCEYFLSKKDALRRERYFKTNPGKKEFKADFKGKFKVVHEVSFALLQGYPQFSP